MSDRADDNDDDEIITIADLTHEQVAETFGVDLMTAYFMIAMEKGEIGPNGDIITLDAEGKPVN